MLEVGEDELICDLAETYGILNYKELPLSLVATLSCGLRENSRIKMKLSGLKVTTDQMIEALQYDVLRMILWTKTKDGAKNRNRPESLLSKLLKEDKKDKDELLAFDTPEEYENFMKAKREEWKNGR